MDRATYVTGNGQVDTRARTSTARLRFRIASTVTPPSRSQRAGRVVLAIAASLLALTMGRTERICWAYDHYPRPDMRAPTSTRLRALLTRDGGGGLIRGPFSFIGRLVRSTRTTDGVMNRDIKRPLPAHEARYFARVREGRTESTIMIDQLTSLFNKPLAAPHRVGCLHLGIDGRTVIGLTIIDRYQTHHLGTAALRRILAVAHGDPDRWQELSGYLESPTWRRSRPVLKARVDRRDLKAGDKALTRSLEQAVEAFFSLAAFSATPPALVSWPSQASGMEGAIPLAP